MGVAVYDPDESFRPHDPRPGGEMDMAKWKVTPTPLLGSHVMYRHDMHDDVTDAVVLGVRIEELDGYPTEAFHSLSGMWRPLPPWPLLTLDTLYGVLRTREARVRGSAGWLPLDWHQVAQVAA